MLQAARHTITRVRVGIWHQHKWHDRGLWYGLLLVWLVVAVHVTLLTRARPPHPALALSCYYAREGRASPYNSCCRLFNYTRRDVAACVRNAAMEFTLMQSPPNIDEEEPHFHSPNEYLVRFRQSSPRSLSTTEGALKPFRVFPGWSWVVAGDSRMRQVFSALVTRLSGPRLKYRKPSTQNKWRSIHELVEPLRIGKLHEDIELYHMDLPLRLQFYWDPLLQRIPKMATEWISNNTNPSLLLLGTGLHWMKDSLPTFNSNGPESALKIFHEHLMDMIPLLEQLAPLSNIIIQLQDHVQESHIFEKYQGIYSNLNIDRYNAELKSMVSSSKITLWDSNIPFSDAYVNQCMKNNKRTIDKTWDCNNPLHTGYVMVEQYANMIINDICNPYLQLGEAFC